MEQPDIDTTTVETADPQLTEAIRETQATMLRARARLGAKLTQRFVDAMEPFIDDLRKGEIPHLLVSAEADRAEWEAQYGRYLTDEFSEQVTQHFHEAKRRALETDPPPAAGETGE